VRWQWAAAVSAVLALTAAGCGIGGEESRDDPIRLSMWHYYRDQMKSVADQLVGEFNATVGREKGIVVDVTSIVDAATQEKKLEAIAADDPGAPELPDLATAYPKTALVLRDAGLIAPLDPYMSENETAAYVPAFLDEGRLGDGKLYVFPVAKSTEVLFLNRTLFDRFSAATGVDTEALATFEGVAGTAAKYYEWTDQLTPQTPGDGKAFLAPDSWFNLAFVQSAQLGADLVAQQALNTSGPAFDRAWDFASLPALGGAFAVAEGYSSDYAVTGEVIAAIGSTAGILYYGDSVTYPDNSQEPVEYEVLPYPVMEGGEQVALQRGAGMVVAASDPEREHAAVTFLKWLTGPEQNLRFVRSTGYLPVTNEAFTDRLAHEIAGADDPRIGQLLATAVTMHQEYRFVKMPLQANLDDLSEDYEDAVKHALKEGRREVLEGAVPADVSRAARATIFQG
jgi:multiple sugar transport system substrate-binding protein